jgi:hypothetical protein
MANGLKKEKQTEKKVEKVKDIYVLPTIKEEDKPQAPGHSRRDFRA